jgi:hypothetical protein
MDEGNREVSPAYKPSASPWTQGLVGFAIGICFGPMLGVLGGACGAPVGAFINAIFGLNSSPYVGFRANVIAGSLIGALLGLPSGLCVGILVRFYSTIVRDIPLDEKGGTISGIITACLCATLILVVWQPPFTTWVMMSIHSLIVGWGTGYIAVLAKPGWAAD